MRLQSKGSLLALIFLGFVFVSSISGVASTSNTYIAQAAAGSANGGSCANAYAYTFFNAAGNWGTGSNQIGPGTTVHLCGTIAAALTAQGNGSASSPVLFFFEPGAKVSMPACPSSGCLNLQNRSYITVDGGTTCGFIRGSVVPCNGTIESTLNGTQGAACTGGPCNQQSATNGVVFWGGMAIEVRNLNIWNMYVHRSASDNATACQCQAAVGDGTGSTVHNIVSHDNAWSFIVQGNNGSAYNISVYNTDHCFAVTSATSNVSIHDNQCYNPYVWDTSSNAWHHDGIHLYTYSGTVDGTLIYNNYFWGDWGNNVTAHIYTEGNVSTAGVSNTLIFNNYFRDCLTGDNGGACTAAGPQGNGTISLRGVGNSSGNSIFNNTMTTSNCVLLQNQANVSYENNISCGMNNLGNVTFRVNSNNVTPDAGVSTITGKLSAGSAAIGAGANLTSLGIALLDVDRAGVARPASGVWDAGAYVFNGGPSPPTGLTAVSQ